LSTLSTVNERRVPSGPTIGGRQMAELVGEGTVGSEAGGLWYREVSTQGWKALLLAGLGWLFEVYEVFILSLTIPALIMVFGLTRAEAGLIGSVSAIGLIIGGIALGWAADRFGRVRTLVASILIYSIFTGLTAFAPSATVVGALRALAGFGMGGAWTAGAALVAETWGPKHRGKGGALMQMGLPFGSLLAIGVVLAISQIAGDLETGSWRWVYAVGALPIVILFPIALVTPESPVWLARTREAGKKVDVTDLMRRENFSGLLRAFGFIFFVQYVYWAVFTWTPTFLVTVKHLDFVRSLGFTLSQQIGSLVGFVGFAMIVDRIGRRPTFAIYLLIGAIAVWSFVTIDDPTGLLIASFFTGVGVTGLFAGMGPFAAELVPNTSARGFAMGIAYNGGRIGGLLAPYLVGALATSAEGFQTGMLTTVVAFALALVVVLVSPETRGAKLA
jgi:MFS family permease